MFAVVVDVAPPPEPPSLAATLIAACSDAVPSGSCTSASEPEDSRPVRARASVRWLGRAEERASLTIRVYGAGEPRMIDRLLTFSSVDDRRERWRTVGFAVGALVGVEEARPAEPPSSTVGEAASPAPEPKGAPADRSGTAAEGDPSRHRPVWLGIGAAAAPGLTGGTWRFGPWLRGEYDLEAVPLSLGLSGSFAVSPHDAQGLKATWVGLGVATGLYLDIPSIDLQLRLRTELLAEWLSVAVHDGSSGLEDSGSRWSVGPRLSVQGCWPRDSLVAGVAGASAWTLLDETTIQVGGAETATAPWGAFSLDVGLRLAVP